MSYKQPAIYILASKHNGTLYTGVTSNLEKRLVWVEFCDTMQTAITREKQIKA